MAQAKYSKRFGEAGYLRQTLFLVPYELQNHLAFLESDIKKRVEFVKHRQTHSIKYDDFLSAFFSLMNALFGSMVL